MLAVASRRHVLPDVLRNVLRSMPSRRRKLTSLDPRPLLPDCSTLTFKPQLLLPEVAPALREVPSLMALQACREAFGSTVLLVDDRFLILALLQTPDLSLMGKNGLAFLRLEPIL